MQGVMEYENMTSAASMRIAIRPLRRADRCQWEESCTDASGEPIGEVFEVRFPGAPLSGDPLGYDPQTYYPFAYPVRIYHLDSIPREGLRRDVVTTTAGEFKVTLYYYQDQRPSIELTCSRFQRTWCLVSGPRLW